jgi:hypothetical protein
MEDGDLLLEDVYPPMETRDYAKQDLDTAKEDAHPAKKDVNPPKQAATASINGSCRR